METRYLKHTTDLQGPPLPISEDQRTDADAPLDPYGHPPQIPSVALAHPCYLVLEAILRERIGC
jgi:hypothetical protein